MAGTFTNLLDHVIFSTKHREPLVVPSIREELYRDIGGIIRGEGGALIEIGGMLDHVHIVARFKADASPSEMLRDIKANFSKWVNDRPGDAGRFAWQAGYAASSASESRSAAVVEYVRNQEEHHRRKTFQEEFVEFLRRHGIEYDERYLWG